MLIVATVVLTVLIAAICLIGAVAPKVIPLCFDPTGGTQGTPSPGQGPACPSSTARPAEPSGLDVAIVAVMGLLGGALSDRP